MHSILRSARRVAAFTLLEIMLVVAIIMLLLGAGAFFLGDFIGVGQTARVQADISTMSTSLKTYQMMNGFYPTSAQGLNALVTQPGGEPKPRVWNQLMTQLPKDPWGNDYVYVCPGRKNTKGFDLYSKGKDGQEGTPDDVGNF